MSIAGKKSVDFVKQDLASQKTPAIGFKNLRFAHKATANQEVINLASLTTPTEDMYASFVNPTPTELNSANLLFNRSNLVLISSLSGVMSSSMYRVTGNLSIQLNEPALENEIFEGVILSVARSGVQMVDVVPVVSTGTLAASATDYNVGTPFRVNRYSSFQQGEILVFLDGQLMKRNVGNATAGVSADGDYQELDSGSGSGTVIRFNVTSPSAREVTVVSNGLAFFQADDSAMAMIETLAGQIDAMIPTLAAVAGVDETDFQGAPNFPDSKAFGDRVLGLEEPGSPGVPKNATVSVAGAVKKNKWQRKILPSNISSTTSNVASLALNNLVIGRTYRLSLNVFVQTSGSSATERVSLIAVHNGSALMRVLLRQDGGPADTRVVQAGNSIVFVATATTVLFDVTIDGTGVIGGDGTTDGTFVQLEELPNHEVTTDWT